MPDPKWAEQVAYVVEGVCPKCRGQLERRYTYGYCAPCQHGWAVRPASEKEMWMGTPVLEEVIVIECSDNITRTLTFVQSAGCQPGGSGQ
jgi:hypothetical protein